MFIHRLFVSFAQDDSRDGFESRQAPADMRKLVVCKETGETLLHKAARLGYEVWLHFE